MTEKPGGKVIEKGLESYLDIDCGKNPTMNDGGKITLRVPKDQNRLNYKEYYPVWAYVCRSNSSEATRAQTISAVPTPSASGGKYPFVGTWAESADVCAGKGVGNGPRKLTATTYQRDEVTCKLLNVRAKGETYRLNMDCDNEGEKSRRILSVERTSQGALYMKGDHVDNNLMRCP
ncbi:hypothetical protein JNW90_28965 [Micromonospora sp. STR1s_5]|nr:hypothetical protein [Micromonospora sp. STR1s_5]